MRFTKVILLALCLILALSPACAAGRIKHLPIDLSGGAPVNMNLFNGNLKVYEDPSIRVERDSTYSNEWRCAYYYAFITVHHASQLRTAPAVDFLASKGVPATTMAKRVNAVLAINGDYPSSFSGTKGNTYVLRQGQMYRDTVDPNFDILLIDVDGNFHVLTADQDLEKADKTTVNGKKVINAFQFGPALVMNGEKVSDEYILDYSHSPTFAEPDHRAQRMCIGQIDELHYFTLCVAQRGLPLNELRDLALTLAPDLKTLYVLDGGNSSQMVFLGRKINNVTPETSQNVRPIIDIIYFASAYFED
ncbi:MAG: phosphodiester glycosidase family protein [Clostridia bacterium]|nr:phosphodiester glycosidase family protein [Clostridia bacterium]